MLALQLNQGQVNVSLTGLFHLDLHSNIGITGPIPRMVIGTLNDGPVAVKVPFLGD